MLDNWLRTADLDDYVLYTGLLILAAIGITTYLSFVPILVLRWWNKRSSNQNNVDYGFQLVGGIVIWFLINLFGFYLLLQL